jgi:mannose-1-phosphate guanylyltransferase/mannose-6-phosphate isomerase
MDHASDSRIRPVILCGGAGTRLAPISTAQRPKPFVPLADGKSLLTHTLQRVADAAVFAPPILIGRVADRFALLNHAREAGVTPAAILLEPEPKNTAMAIAVATAYVTETGQFSTLALLPADHWITPVEAWRASIQSAAHAAQATAQLCLLAVHSGAPDASYGHLQLAAAEAGQSRQTVANFIEKPPNPEDFSDYYWNAGQFVATADCLRGLLARHIPEIWQKARDSVARRQVEWEFELLSPAGYEPVAPLSFDRAVVEKCPGIAVALNANWQDLGTLSRWQAATGLGPDHYRDLAARFDRPWGYFELVAVQPGHIEKRLVIYPGCRLSRQRHQNRDEYWEVLQGTANIEKDGQFETLSQKQSTIIRASQWHRLANSGETLLIIKEIQSGNPDENDIERSEDDYGRV